LVRGETVTLADGRVITPDMVLGDPISGVKIVFTGDVARTDTLIDAARDADALVIEGTFLKEDADMARAFGHITASQAAEFALQAGVKGLIITHVSRRYHERDIIAEAQAIFPAAIVARDLDHYIIRRDKAIEKVEQSG
jgi:ribonuclease Z